MAVQEIFKAAMARAHLSRSSRIAVALSGGSDSTALLWMAKQAFPNVIGLTVDHRLRAGSDEEAKRVGDLATAIGVRHHILRVEWEGPIPGRGRYQTEARKMRYNALLGFCKLSELSTLMTAHHLDDQIETLVYRMKMGSGVDGLVGMQEVSRCLDYPGVQLIRPLLTCLKTQLIEVCQEAGLEWVEDPTNQQQVFSRNYIRHLLAEDPALCRGLYHMHATLNKTSQSVSRRVNRLVKSPAVVDTKYGYVIVKKSALLKLSTPALRRVLCSLVQYVSVDTSSISYKVMAQVISALPNLQKTITMQKCLVFPLDRNEIGICGASKIIALDQQPVPITLGQRIHFMKKWEIELCPLPGMAPSNEQYFVRLFNDEDYTKFRHGARRNKLPPLQTRTTLPVVIHKDGTLVSIPHFKYTNMNHKVEAKVQYKPLVSLNDVLRYNHINL